MSDIQNAYDQIVDFLSNGTEKTLLLRGIADKEKHQALLKALNSRGETKGLINLIHTSRNGMEDFFRWAELYEVKAPKKYGEEMRLSAITLYFDNITTKSNRSKYDDCPFDFMIVWPIQSVTRDNTEIQMLKEMAERQKTKKIVYLTIKEPWYNPDTLEPIVDRVIKLDCENDDPIEYRRMLTAYEVDSRCPKY